MENQIDSPEKDPVCGMDVQLDSKWKHEFNGKTIHFCSERCLIKFKADPDHYFTDGKDVNKAIERGPQSSKATYTCPMHPEIVSGKPGACPKCGMALEAKQ